MDIRNIRMRLSLGGRNEPLLHHSAVPLEGGSASSELGDNGSDDLFPSIPPHSEGEGDPNVEPLVNQLAPQLEHIQDLVLSSPSEEIMESRMKCLSRLIEFWEEGKDAMVLVPAKRVILRGSTNSAARNTVLHSSHNTSSAAATTSYVPHLKEPRNGGNVYISNDLDNEGHSQHDFY